MGSNGLTSSRQDVFEKSVAAKFPESYDASVPESLVYSGKVKLTDKIIIDIESNKTITAGKLVLSPTRTYAPIVKRILDNYRSQIHGMIHCSGGGQTKVLHFINDLHIIKNNLYPLPPLFKLIKDESGTDWKEMYQVFNMGHRMEFYVSQSIADDIISISKSFNVDARIIGRVEKSKSKKLTIETEFGAFIY